ncbi:hypothetical protein SKAU_G00421840 [Synaphobranchus kaupii]|uniref:MADF domain-containing protein n=1 Tax=Synaphobranchus kaupii TaxID=118154 RepID=A0A9Q1E6S5_SYNKA|nr:hypothetical protein SKAU_G00421840 [Synaphobranchus kaupii]
MMAEFWTEEREDVLVQLFQEQSCLYYTSLKAYSNRISKKNAICHIAERLGICDKEVSKKMHSLRTQYNRYAKMCPSESSGMKTARQDWILQRLSFLEPHIRKRSSMRNTDDKPITRQYNVNTVMAEFWTAEREDILVQLFEEQSCLYDTSLKAYSNRISKKNAICHIAERLGIGDKEVSKKMHSLRTQYNRYAKMCPSESSGMKTARQDWILQRLSFLEPHIRKRSSMCNTDDKGYDTAEREEEESEEPEEEVKEEEGSEEPEEEVKEEEESEEQEEEVKEEEESEKPEEELKEEESTTRDPPPPPSTVHHQNRRKRNHTERQETEILQTIGGYLQKRPQPKEQDELSAFCNNLEHKMRRIKDETIRLELEHQLEEACYHAVMRDRAVHTLTSSPSPLMHPVILHPSTSSHRETSIPMMEI